MRITSFSRLRASVALAAILPALALAGCNRAAETPGGNAQASYSLPELPATLPLSAGEATPVRYAPEASELPDAAPVRTVRTADPQAGYAYADAAYGFNDALGDAPPDYGFEYEDGEPGSDPWAWQGYDDSLAFAEPVSDGYRSYYYRPGAEQPYFVRDPYYGYGYDNGQLAVVYAADGGIVPYADYGPRIVYAARYLARGRDLYRASRERRRPVIAANWAGRRPALAQYRQSWGRARVSQPQWAAYHQRVAPRAQRHWQDEAIRRQADSRRYADWQAQAFRTPAPPRAIPANWSRADWAQDRQRFTPVRAEAVRDGQRAEVVAARRREVAERRDDRAVAQRRQQAQAERQQAVAARTDRRAQAQEARQEQPGQPERRRAEQAQRVEQRQAQRAQRDEAGERQTAERVRREQARATQAAQRQQAQAARAARPERQRTDQPRVAQQAERGQREQARAAQQAERQQARQAAAGQRAQREQGQQARAAQQAERAQRQQAQQAQAVQREQAQQGRAAQQAERAQRQQAQQAQAAQREPAQGAQQAQRQQAQAARQAQQGQAQQQRQAERQAQRQAGRDTRGPERER